MHTQIYTHTTYKYLYLWVDQTNPQTRKYLDFKPTSPHAYETTHAPKTTQTYAHSQLPCRFSRTPHTHNKNHLIISTSGILGFRPLVDTPCSPASLSVEGIITLPTLPSRCISRDGTEGKTFNQRAKLLPPAGWISTPEIQQSQTDGEGTWSSDYWPVPDVGLARPGGPVGPHAFQPFPNLGASSRDLDLWVDPQRAAWPHIPMQNAWRDGICLACVKEHSIRVFKFMKKAVKHH